MPTNRTRTNTNVVQWNSPTQPINNRSVQTNPVRQWVPSPPGNSQRYAIVAWRDAAPSAIDVPKLTAGSTISDVAGQSPRAIKPVSHVKTVMEPYPTFSFILRNQITTEAQDGSSSPPRKYYPSYRLLSPRVMMELVGWSYQQGFHNLGTRAWVPPSALTPPSRKGELPAQIVKRVEGLNAVQQLIEMKDMPQLAEMWRTRGSIGELARSLNNLLKAEKIGTRNLKWVLGALRSSYLGKVFGIDPTVSLVRDICSLVVNGAPQRKKTFIVTLQGERSEVLNRVTGTTTPEKAYVSGSCAQMSYVRRIDGARVTDVRPYLGAFSDRFRAYQDALIGVNGSRWFWDVAPMGFVCDWFLSIDDLLDTLWANSTHDFKVEYWSSTKSEIVQQWDGEYTEDVGGMFPNPVFSYSTIPSYIQRQSIYNRQPEERPSPLDSLRFRLGPKTAFLTFLIALGYVPSRR